MQSLIKEYGESILAAISVITVIGLFALIYLYDGGAVQTLFTGFCGYLL